jgi:hypothetical protein
MSAILMAILGVYYKSEPKEQLKALIVFTTCDVLTVLIYLLIYTNKFTGV